jgi:hypothetical protein
MRITLLAIRSFLIESASAQRNFRRSVEKIFARGRMRRRHWIQAASKASHVLKFTLRVARSILCEIVEKPHGIGLFVISSESARGHMTTRHRARCEIASRIA